MTKNCRTRRRSCDFQSRAVERDPVHFPRSEQPRARVPNLLVGQREMAGWFVEGDFAEHRPDQPAPSHNRSDAPLPGSAAHAWHRLTSVRGCAGRCATARRACRRRRAPGSQPREPGRRTGCSDRRICHQILRFQHEADVAGATAPRRRIAERVIDNPVSNRPGALEIGPGALRNDISGVLDDAVGGNQPWWGAGTRRAGSRRAAAEPSVSRDSLRDPASPHGS
jgi:hypothetical protein